jgi:CubicO group peptidase (beta-lactamase class C family)
MFQKLIDNKKLAGGNCLVYKNGEILFQESYGLRNFESNAPMLIDTIFRISSLTKPITSVLAMILMEEGKLNLEDPITKWFPHFQDMKVVTKQGEYHNANRIITIFDLLTHTAGFTYSEFQQGKLKDDYFKILGGDIDTGLSNEEWIKGLATLPLVSQPGELFNYGKSTDLLGLLISFVEAKSLGKVMEEKIFEPLGMCDTFFYVPASKRNRCASNFGFNEFGELTTLDRVPLNMAMKERPSDLSFESGGQGLWSTINDYLKFASIFVDNGRSNGKQLLKKESIDLMCSNHLTPYQREHSKLMGNALFKENYGFGLGLSVVTNENQYTSIPCTGTMGSVGWPGAYGAWWTADPMNKAVSIFFSHSMTSPEQLAQGIGMELYEAIDIFSTYSKQLIKDIT